jgi:hypothetical protein
MVDHGGWLRRGTSPVAATMADPFDSGVPSGPPRRPLADHRWWPTRGFVRWLGLGAGWGLGVAAICMAGETSTLALAVTAGAAPLLMGAALGFWTHFRPPRRRGKAWLPLRLVGAVVLVAVGAASAMWFPAHFAPGPWVEELRLP